jgi:hypothetical protein
VGAHAAAVDRVALASKSDAERARRSPDGKWHDAYLPAAFSVKSGDKVVVTIRNYDAAPHTFTSPRLHLNVVIKTGNARFGAPNPATTEYQVVQLRKPKGR